MHSVWLGALASVVDWEPQLVGAVGACRHACMLVDRETAVDTPQGNTPKQNTPAVLPVCCLTQSLQEHCMEHMEPSG